MQRDRDETTAPSSPGLISCAKHGPDHMATALSGAVMGWFCRACERHAAREEGRREGAETMREQAAKTVAPAGPRPCGCDRGGCDCGSAQAAERVAEWDAENSAAERIRALPLPGDKP